MTASTISTPQQPKVSVVMGVHNGGADLVQSVLSVLKQTRTDFELIVIDDCSTDDTPAFLSSLSDPRLRVLTNTNNLGLTRSLNLGIHAAKGVFIARQDADDISHPERLSKQVEFLESHPEIVGVGSCVQFIDANDRHISTWDPPLHDREIKSELAVQNAFCHGAMMVRRQALLSVGGYREKFRYTQDYDLWLRISENWALANLPDRLYFMRRGAGTISRKKLGAQLTFHLIARELARERHRAGIDSYDRMNENDIDGFAFGVLGIARRESHILRAENAHNYAQEALAYGDYKGAIRLAFTALFLNPLPRRLRFLLVTLHRAVARTIGSMVDRHIRWRFRKSL